MAKWLAVGKHEDFPPGTVTPCRVEQRPCVVIATDDALYVLADSCPHAGKPLHDGSVCGHKITCRHHGYAYDLRTGRNVDFPYDEPPVRKLPVRISGDVVQVDLDGPARPHASE